MAGGAAFGFREVILDEPFGGKWMDVDMNLGGGHGTFQGTKFCDRAGGYSYKSSSSPRQIMQNRFIYWRVLNDMLELTEVSMDYNLEDNQIRYIFRDSPIVSPITIQEEEDTITIMVVTVTSVNRFSFTHPSKINVEDGLMRNRQPSIFHQVLNKPMMTLKSFNLFDHAINIPVPTTAAAHIMPYKAGHVFAIAYESGSVTICRISSEDNLNLYDLRQSNIFTRLLSYTPALLRGPTTSPDAAIGLRFFTAKIERNKKLLVLCTLSMNGHLRLYIWNNMESMNDWTVISDVVVDKRFALDSYTDCNMLLRMSCESEDSVSILPKCVVLVPFEGFRVFDVVKSTSTHPLQLVPTGIVDFREPVMDVSVSGDFLFVLVSNPEEETDWEVKSYNLNDTLIPRFNLALLEVQPYADIGVFPPSLEPKEFYFDLVFNKCSFSASTIYNALSTFESSAILPKYEHDWERTKEFAVSVIENEIRMDMSATDEPLMDEDYYEIVLKYWLGFYNSCVEYHINTVKPLGLFYEKNTQMVCIVKKSRISFLRPTEFFETLYYFPHCVSLPSEIDERSAQISLLLKYFEIIDFIESTTDQTLKNKVSKRLIEDRAGVKEICGDIANFLVETDPYSMDIERRHFMPMLSSKLRELGGDGDRTMRLVLNLLSYWERDVELADVEGEEEMEERLSLSEMFMGSRFGANLTQRVLKQFLQHRFTILRNTLILQSLITNFYADGGEGDGSGFRMTPSLQDQKEAEEAIIHCFGLLNMMEKSAEFVPDSLKERGIKVANVLNTYTVDHSIQNKLKEFWPIKLVEMFCHSTHGGLAIRSRVNQLRNSKIVAYVDAAGRALWPNDDSPDHPFEEFLISCCQYSSLHQYATNMAADINRKSASRKFYHALADMFNGDFDLALGRILSISNLEIQDDTYFSCKILGWRPQEAQSIHPMLFFQRTINLFQIFGHTKSIQTLAGQALSLSTEDRWNRIMSVLGFKSALLLEDYKAAYKFICQMPQEKMQVGNEKPSSLRRFISQILEKSDIEVLINMDMDDPFFRMTTAAEETEKILGIQAKLANPLAEDGVYQMIYLYHLSRDNYRKAASAMFERVIQIGVKGKGRAGVQCQRDSYLDMLMALSSVEDKLLAYAERNEEIDIVQLLFKARDKRGGLEGEELTSEPIQEIPISSQIRTMEDARKECELCNCLLLLNPTVDPDPLKFNDGKRRAEETLGYLANDHYYDAAINLATMWNLSYESILKSFAVVCVNLHYKIYPKGGNEADYLKHVDLSDIPNCGNNLVNLALGVLKRYLNQLEKPLHTYLHKVVTLEFLSYSFTLPRWLVDSYKLRDCSQLLICYLRYGELEEANELACDVMDAALGRRTDRAFDPSIQTITAYTVDPVIPYTAIDSLSAYLLQAMAKEKDKNSKYHKMYEALKERSEAYVIRVNETRLERLEIFGRNEFMRS